MALRRADSSGKWRDNLNFQTINLTPNKTTLLIQSGRGCARGGQGSNGAMWLVRLDGHTPVILASPDTQFNGWLYSIQKTESFIYSEELPLNKQSHRPY